MEGDVAVCVGGFEVDPRAQSGFTSVDEYVQDSLLVFLLVFNLMLGCCPLRCS